MQPALTAAILAQQGQFTGFVGWYCCAIPLGFVLVLGLVYFGVRWYAHRGSDDSAHRE